MANIFQLETVKYICCCGSLQPICFVYFCRHCLRLRCPYCVSHEVDSHFCGNCSENMPSAEAKQKKNRCNSCYDCPSCRQTLSIRGATTQVTSEEDPTKLVQKKLYYLICGFCRWSSREASIPDTTSPTGPWAVPENPEAGHLDEVGEHFRMLALREKSSKEKKYVHKSKFLAAGRHGVAHLLPKRFPIINPEEMGKAIPPSPYTAPSFGLEELLELEDEFYNEDIIVAKTTILDQRLNQPDTQSDSYAGLFPTHKHLLVKRSLRCRVCERNISKPEYSPVSIKFKIQLNAYYHVPHVRLMTPLREPFLPGTKTRIVLRLANPTQFPTTVKFLPFAFAPLKKDNLSILEELDHSATADTSLTSNQTQIVKEISVLPVRNENFTMNCYLVPPENELILPPRDETSDFDEFAETPEFNDNPNFIPWRKANKAAVYLEIERLVEQKAESTDKRATDPPVLGLTIEYDYTNTIVPQESKISNEPQKVRIQAHLLIELDRIQ